MNKKQFSQFVEELKPLVFTADLQPQRDEVMRLIQHYRPILILQMSEYRSILVWNIFYNFEEYGTPAWDERLQITEKIERRFWMKSPDDDNTRPLQHRAHRVLREFKETIVGWDTGKVKKWAEHTGILLGLIGAYHIWLLSAKDDPTLHTDLTHADFKTAVRAYLLALGF